MNADIDLALATFKEKSDGYREAESYYNGTVSEVFASAKMRRLLERTGKRFRINFASTPVDAVLNRLEITNVFVTNDEPASAALQKVWRDNDMDLESPDQHRWALVYGDDFLFVWPDTDDEGNIESIELSYNSPLTTQVFYEAENPRQKKFAAKMWQDTVDGQPRVRMNLYYRDRIEKFVSRGKVAKSSNDFELFYDGSTDDEGNSVWPVENPYDEIPVYHFRTQRPKGRPEHANAYGPQDMLNKLVITQMATTDFHGFPQRYALTGKTDTSGASSEADDFATDAGEASPDNEAPALQSGPGSMWWLPGIQSVGQFDSADVDHFLKPYAVYIESMAAVTQTPLHNFTQSGSVPSGESLRVKDAPLLKKAVARKNSFDRTWKEACTFILRLLGFEDAAPGISWAPMASYQDADFWTVVKTKIEAGVPPQQALIEAGYTTDVVAEWFANNTYAPEALAKVADAIQRLAAAAAMGLVSNDEARALLPTTITAAENDE